VIIKQKPTFVVGFGFMVGARRIYSGKALTLRAAFGVAYADASAEPLRWFKSNAQRL